MRRLLPIARLTPVLFVSVLPVRCDDDNKRSEAAKGHPSTKDPLDCQNPVCGKKMSMFRAALKHNRAALSVTTADAKIGDTKSPEPPVPVPSKDNDDAEAESETNCPLDKDALGVSTWNLLHTMAAYYPEHPSSTDESRALEFIKSLAHLYPCHICAKDFQEFVSASPPRASTRRDLIMWVCELHNDVNQKLGKEVMPCELAALDERWRLGKPSCWGQGLDDENMSAIGDVK